MNGIELAKAFFLEYGKPMLEEKFPHLMDKIAVGVAGGGSDSYGFDDVWSRDHDYEAGFCIFLPEEDVLSRRDEFLLERAYNALPKQFMGVVRPNISPVGGARRGVMRMSDFFRATTGTSDGKLSEQQWLTLPENYLFEATNGEVFYDGLGLFTSIRHALLDMPRDVRLKKIAGNMLIMNQSGQYNYSRCLNRGDSAAAQLAMFEFVSAAINVAFALSEKYRPYYKWCFYALEKTTRFGDLAKKLEQLICLDNGEENALKKNAVIAEICSEMKDSAMRYSGAQSESNDLERAAYRINDEITSPQMRNLHILAAVTNGFN